MSRWKRPSVTLVVCALLTLVAVFAFVGMLAVFVAQSAPVWRSEGWSFFTQKQWFYRQQLFGIAPMLYGTVVVAAVALLVATPAGIGTAVFASEFLPRRARLTVKVAIELLAGIPSVVYGLLGIVLLRDWIYRALQPFDPLSGDTLLTAGLLVGVMLLPTLMTLSDDALRSVPASQRLAARGLGLTATETALRVTLPQAWPGLLGALLLAGGRALGEMIAVFLVVGRQDNQWPESLLSLRPMAEAGQTLSSKLGGPEINIAYGDPLHWAAMVALGLVLLVLVATLTLAGTLIRRRKPHAP